MTLSDKVSPAAATRESLGFKLTSSFAAQITAFLLGTTSQIIVARALGPEGKGLFSLALFLATALFTLVRFSYSGAIAHYMGRYPQDRPALVGNGFFLAVVWGGLATVLALSLADDLHRRWFAQLQLQQVTAVMVALVPMLMMEYSGGALLGLDWLGRFNLGMIVKELLLLTGLLALNHYRRLSVDGALAVWVGANLLAALFQAASAFFGLKGCITVDFRKMLPMTKFALKGHVAGVFSFLKQRFDIFLVAYFLSPSDVGVYSVAAGMVLVLWYLPGAVAQVLIPYVARRDDQAANRMSPRLVRLGFIATALAGVALGASGWMLIDLMFGAAFLGAYPALLVLLPGAVVYSLAKMLAGDLLGRGLPQYASMVSVAAFVLNVAINYFFIPRFGIIGAAMASTLTHSFTGLMFLYYFCRESGVKAAEVVVPRRQDLYDLTRLWRRPG